VNYMNDFQQLKMPILNANYKGIPIKSDSRVHIAVMEVLKDFGINSLGPLKFLDVATGKGALAQRVIDSYENIDMDCNDLEGGILAEGAKNIFSIDLNGDFDFKKKYDVIMAVEVIEHLENPFHFIRLLKKHLSPSGFILLTTPNTDSFFDRIWNLYSGYPYYFGERGIVNSGGHITMTPEWLLRHIANVENLDFKICPQSNSVNIRDLIGFKSRVVLAFLYPLRFFIKNLNDRSGTICIFRHGKA